MLIIWVTLAVIVTAFACWCYFTAQRLNRLHIGTDAALSSLQAALDRRADLVGVLTPGAEADARQAIDVPLLPGSFTERAQLEHRISAHMRNMEGDPPELLERAVFRVDTSYRFYNDYVTRTRALRTRPLVRLMRLGGTAPLPEYFALSLNDSES
ncbi:MULTISPECIES: hypothetical protein [unclassified Corynebacterium]|uniref:hypothetical protein n=1 Tax=unclassified Corynebacterium TaxID=2624378 RepID=UPI003524EA37